jgi:hypothetical protein
MRQREHRPFASAKPLVKRPFIFLINAFYCCTALGWVSSCAMFFYYLQLHRTQILSLFLLLLTNLLIYRRYVERLLNALNVNVIFFRLSFINPDSTLPQNTTFTFQAAVKKIKDDKEKYVPMLSVYTQWGAWCPYVGVHTESIVWYLFIRVVLLEQYNQRTREACLLVSDLPPATLTVPSAARTGSALSPSFMQPAAAHISASSRPR